MVIKFVKKRYRLARRETAESAEIHRREAYGFGYTHILTWKPLFVNLNIANFGGKFH